MNDSMPMTDNAMEDGLSFFAALLVAAVDAVDVDTTGQAQPVVVETLKIESPMEFSFSGAGDMKLFDAETPRQTVETSVMPVFHRISATIARREVHGG